MLICTKGALTAAVLAAFSIIKNVSGANVGTTCNALPGSQSVGHIRIIKPAPTNEINLFMTPQSTSQTPKRDFVEAKADKLGTVMWWHPVDISTIADFRLEFHDVKSGKLSVERFRMDITYSRKGGDCLMGLGTKDGKRELTKALLYVRGTV